jgi:hypothetical protein
VTDNNKESTVAVWGMLLGAGVVAIVIGILVVGNVWNSLRFVAAIVAIALIVAGVMGIAGAWRARGGPAMTGSIVALIGGIVLIAWPDITIKALAVIVGVTLIFAGVIVAVASASERRENRTAGIVSGIVLAVVGLIVVAWPGPTLAVLTALAGIAVILFGVFLVVQGLRLRKTV